MRHELEGRIEGWPSYLLWAGIAAAPFILVVGLFVWGVL